MGLCQDTEHDIRGTLCTQLGPLAEGLFGGAGAGVEDEGRVKELGEELIELLRDEDSRVHPNAFPVRFWLTVFLVSGSAVCVAVVDLRGLSPFKAWQQCTETYQIRFQRHLAYNI